MLDVPKSSVFLLVHTLTNRKYLHRDPITEKFIIGLKLFEIGNSYLENTDFFGEVKKAASRVSKECNETVHLAILEGTEVVYIFKEESTQAIRMASSIGKRLPAHTTAIGKALLSGFDEKQILEMHGDIALSKLTDYTVVDIQELIRQISDTKKNGYAFEKEESTEGISCVAAPIRNRSSNICAAISIAVPVFRADKERMQVLKRLVKKGAEEIEGILKNADYDVFF